MKNVETVIGKVDEIKLTQSFMDACSNKGFKDYVYGLNIKEETLKKYTSSLEDSYEEYHNCQNCTSLEKCKNKVQGYVYTPEKNGELIMFSYLACKKLQEELKNNNLTLTKETKLGLTAGASTSKDEIEELKQHLENIIKEL